MNKKLTAGIMPIILVFVLAVVAIGAYFLLAPKIKQFSKPTKVYKVGVLSGLSFVADITDGFKERMAELGYKEGVDISYDVQKTDFDMAQYKKILRGFVDNQVDLILVFPTEASQEAKSATNGTDIPVVFTNVFTEDTGLVNSIREPGGNITGVRWGGPDLALQRFEVMREIVPNAKRMLIAYQKGYPIVKSQLEALRPAASKVGVTLVEIPAANAAELKAELNKQAKSINKSTDAILIIAEPLGVTPDAFVVLSKFAVDHGIPVGGAYMSLQGYESVFGLTPRGAPQGRQAAALADKIFRGTAAGTIPVVTAENYFQLNYKAAQKLGIKLSEGLLGRANEVLR